MEIAHPRGGLYAGLVIEGLILLLAAVGLTVDAGLFGMLLGAIEGTVPTSGTPTTFEWGSFRARCASSPTLPWGRARASFRY